ncbi:MAG TPA: hypothetical protein VIV40_28245 [Kofleriaceae bacterium]
MAWFRVSILSLSIVLVACSGSSSSEGPDGGGDDGGLTADASLCSPACSTEPNADVSCTAFATCESTCSAGFSRCGDACVTETPMQCGAGCEQCPTPSNGAPTCDQGVCGVACNAGYVACEGYSGVGCCPYASEVVAPNELGGYMPSVAVDGLGKLHVAYYGSAEHKLMYAAETASGLVRESARWYWSSGGGARFELALGKSGPLILYTYPNSRTGLFLAERRATGWSHSTLVSTSTPTGFGLVTDRAGRAHACFTEATGGISYAIRKGDRWTITSLGDAEAKGACAIAVDHDGIAHIAYYRNAAADVVYAKGSTAGTFTTAVVDSAGSVGSELAIAVAADGTPHIAAYRSDTQDLRWAVATNGTWNVQDVSTGRIGSAPHIAIGGNGLPVMTYWDADLYRIVVAVRNANQTWTESVFEDVSGGAAPLAAAPDGSIWAATGDRDVLAYHLANNAWSAFEIDTSHKAGYDVTLLHPSAQPALVYTNTGGDNVERVEIATKASSGWSYTTLATAGTQPVAAVDSANHVHIAYQTGTSLSYATNSGGSYVIEPIATAASDASIAVSSTGTPYVAYVGNPATSSYALILAQRGATSWTTTTIGAAAAYGTYQRPVVRVVNGVVHLLWYDGVAKSIVYASSADGYTKVTLEPTADAGHDLYVSPAGVPHACYFRRTSSSWPDLRYATRATTTWSSVLVSPPGTAVNDDICAIRADASGTIAIARSLRYGAGLGELVLTTLGATNVSTLLQDDFYSSGIGFSIGASGFEVAATGRPYNGSGVDQNRVRWAHK